MTNPAETTRVTISKRGAAVLNELAAAAGVTPREYLEALLHYGGSQMNRPGSWEANCPFELRNYVGDDAHADRWF